MHISFTTSPYFQNRVNTDRKPFVPFDRATARHTNPVFSGDSSYNSPEPSSWWQHLSQIIYSFLSAAPAKQSPFKIRANDPLPDGTLIASGAQWEQADKAQPVAIQLLSPETMTAMEINRRKDKTLRAYFNSNEFRTLKQQVPSATASENAEMAFLHQLNQSTNHQFDKVGISHAVQIANSDEKDYRSHYLKKLSDYIQQGRKGKQPEYHASRLLGHSMRKGVGVCRHRALLNLLSIREISTQGLTATYTMGLLQDLLEQNSDSYGNLVHVYNVVTMPSGRKYIVDPFNDPLHDGRGTVLPKKKIAGHKYPPNYVSFDHILKQDNSNAHNPVLEPEDQQTTWLVRPSLVRNDSRQTI